MVLKEILAISGEPGLFKFIAQGKNAIIIEHLESKKRSSSMRSQFLLKKRIFPSQRYSTLSTGRKMVAPHLTINLIRKR
jgi:hypothetical protein